MIRQQCSVDTDCPDGQVCVDGQCTAPPIACSIDADCPEGYLCVEGVCVKKGAGFPWAALGIGGAAVVGVALILSGRRKGKEK